MSRTPLDGSFVHTRRLIYSSRMTFAARCVYELSEPVLANVKTTRRAIAGVFRTWRFPLDVQLYYAPRTFRNSARAIDIKETRFYRTTMDCQFSGRDNPKKFYVVKLTRSEPKGRRGNSTETLDPDETFELVTGSNIYIIAARTDFRPKCLSFGQICRYECRKTVKEIASRTKFGIIFRNFIEGGHFVVRVCAKNTRERAS